MAKKRRKTEAQLDLENIRKLKRLTKRVYAGLEAMEKWLLKVDKWSDLNPDPEAPRMVHPRYGTQLGHGPTQFTSEDGVTHDTGIIRKAYGNPHWIQR